ncbi:hypothetical protein D3C87_878720 [compost metagenome]
MQEVQAVARFSGAAEYQQGGSGSLGGHGVSAGDAGVGAVGGNEVDQRLRVFQVVGEVHPAAVWGQLSVAGHVEELTARGVQGRNAGVAATSDVDGGQVERQAH